MADNTITHGVLETYLLDSANAVYRLAKRVESMSDSITPQDAQVASAIIMGTPKPSAANVASLVNFKRRELKKEDLPKELLESVSVTRFVQRINDERTSRAIREIYEYINGVAVPGNAAAASRRRLLDMNNTVGGSLRSMRNANAVHIGLTESGDPVVDTTKYKLVKTRTQPVASFNDISRDKVKDELKVIFSDLSISSDDLDSLLDLVIGGKAIEAAMKWADSVEKQLLSSSSSLTHQQNHHSTLTEQCMPSAVEAVHGMHTILRDNFYKFASQLTDKNDIALIQSGMQKCIFMLNTNSLERILTSILFFSCFNIVNTPQELIALEAGVLKKQSITRNSANATLTNLCFFLQNFHVNCADAIVRIGELANHRSYSETLIRNLLSVYSSNIFNHWKYFNDILDKKKEIIDKNFGVRGDVVDCRVNLANSVCDVVHDALGTVKDLVESLERFLEDLRIKQALLDKFHNGK